MKLVAAIAVAMAGAALARNLPDKEVECDGKGSDTACTYIDPSGKNQTGTCQLDTDSNSPLYNMLLCTKAVRTDTGTEGQATPPPGAGQNGGDGGTGDDASVDQVACASSQQGDACEYSLPNGDSSVTITGVCKSNGNGLACQAQPASGDTSGTGETALESSCDGLEVGNYCEVAYGDIVVEGTCDVNPSGDTFCMPDSGGYLRH
eukprot:INCI5695.1.p1 GENE.INCI5695.1~~INCI5695.1.p1  ORF type:complete len:205 (-),score=43.34 INCI5695.1:136-750(-)